ncbi:putative ubiquitin activating enzyme [Leptomonas seymouri]|uniref:NEDD8-activating enzyme E1 catalytic subunit n=1 Tax=Leptomonas seymouri TaxID=5684 RepID=A0A0N1IIU8_LEPSE|nr:putative ubiquitin activating enzyme [Leptomonas seymouri]|eukprot:KPI84471.1 putative ubiquitin activating enzyme [Leptomonas seymouri]
MASRSALDVLTGADSQFTTPDFDPELKDWSFVEVLVIGAGGIGCELLHLLALSGFARLTVIDMDFIELSNLNRQFLFTQADIGKAKSSVAAAAIMARCPDVSVTAVVGRMEDQPDEFYSKFNVVLLGVDSIAARRWINRKVAQLATRTVIPAPPTATAAATIAPVDVSVVRSVGLCVIDDVQPIIDTGTEGFEGHCRVIHMRHNATPCIECEMYLYNDGATRQTVPLCTLESVPRAPEHCVLYAQMKEWPEERGGATTQAATGAESNGSRGVAEGTLDPDNAEHVHWIAQRARARQMEFGIGGPPIDDLFALGVIKNVVPAVGFTNAYVAGQAVTEVLKWLTGCAPGLDNFTFFNGATVGGVFSDVQRCCGVPTPGGGDVGGRCLVCGPQPVVAVDAARVSPSAFVRGLIDVLTADEVARAALRGGTASLMFRSGAAGQVVEVALPPLGSPEGEGRATGCVEDAAAATSLADLLCAAGHTSFVKEWKKGSQMARVECFGNAEARAAALVRWEGGVATSHPAGERRGEGPTR